MFQALNIVSSKQGQSKNFLFLGKRNFSFSENERQIVIIVLRRIFSTYTSKELPSCYAEAVQAFLIIIKKNEGKIS